VAQNVFGMLRRIGTWRLAINVPEP